MSQIEEEILNNCPYCSKPLEKQYKRKEKCPYCKKFIFVRDGKMVTEYGSKKIDWLKRVDYLCITDGDIELVRTNLMDKFKQEPLFNDICWNILNELLLRNANNEDKRKSIYLELARILEIEDKDNSEMLINASKIELIEYKKAGFKFVQTYNCNDDSVCEECKKMADEAIPIDKAIEMNPIPNRCKNKYCRCWYGTKGSLLDLQE